MLIQCLWEKQGSFHRTASTRLAGLCEFVSHLQNLPLHLQLLQLHGELSSPHGRHTEQAETLQAATRRNVRCSSGDMTDAFEVGNVAYFSLKMKDLLIALCREANMETDKVWGLTGFPSASCFWWNIETTKKPLPNAPGHGTALSTALLF